MRKISLRGSRAVVLNLSASELPDLASQLARIGISVALTIPSNLPDTPDFDFLFIILSDGIGCLPVLKTYPDGKGPVRIAILESETPTVLDLLADVEADAVLIAPLRPMGLLAGLVHAQDQRRKNDELREKVSRLERKLKTQRLIENAKWIIASGQNVSMDQAFAIMRRHAMAERISVEQVAETVVSADRILSEATVAKRSLGQTHRREKSHRSTSNAVAGPMRADLDGSADMSSCPSTTSE